jgi:hypothetical protein
MSEPLKEALKELGRLVLFGVVSIIITFVLDKLTNVPQTETVIIVAAALRFLDKWIHEHSKDVKKPAITGISPF